MRMGPLVGVGVGVVVVAGALLFAPEVLFDGMAHHLGLGFGLCIGFDAKPGAALECVADKFHA